ncbi:MAG: N-acetylmuramoyl-L-alanine amidase [Acetatifactor sp.]|nr:N-acetylmuramoyl-L-alanine amidase [Acetatifactor sp.]
MTLSGDGYDRDSADIEMSDTGSLLEDEEAAPVVKERPDILVALDPGHGGEDEGCSRQKVLEKDVNLQIAKAVESRLVEMGYQVMFTRDGDTSLTLDQRVELANAAGADAYISIHQNACEEQSSDISGIETWYNEEKGEQGSKRLAQLVHNDVILYTEARDRKVIADDTLRVIRETNMPACLVETGFLSNGKEREKLCSEEYQERIAEGIVSGIDLYFFPKTMYLTFDDGPTAENTDVVLDILKEHNIKATFFLVGESVERYPEVAKRIAQEGHTIGIHCYNHDYKKLYQSVDSYVADFEKAREVVKNATGVEVKLFRFPGGSINAYNKGVYENIIEEMTGRGYIYFDWNASLEDATKHNEPELLLRNAKESTFGRRKVVMLAHDTVYNTVSCLEELIEQFPEYRMLPLTEEVEPVQF